VGWQRQQRLIAHRAMQDTYKRRLLLASGFSHTVEFILKYGSKRVFAKVISPRDLEKRTEWLGVCPRFKIMVAAPL